MHSGINVGFSMDASQGTEIELLYEPATPFLGAHGETKLATWVRGTALRDSSALPRPLPDLLPIPPPPPHSTVSYISFQHRTPQIKNGTLTYPE